MKAYRSQSRMVNGRRSDRISTHIVFCLLTFATFCVFAGKSGRASDAVETVKPIAEVKLQPNRVPVLPARLFGELQYFVFDTGSDFTAIDNGLRAKLGKPVRTATAGTLGEDIRVDVFNAPDLFLNGLRLKGRHVACMDLGSINELLGEELVGILGMDLLNGYVVELDLARGVLRIYDSVPESVKRASERLEMQNRQNKFFVDAQLPAIGEERFVLDTGLSGSLMLRPGTFEHLTSRGDVRDRYEVQLMAADGEHTIEDGTLREFTLGQFKHTGLTATKQIHDRGYSIIGSEYLRRFVVVFDFPGGALYLRPSKEYDSPEEPLDKSGLVPARRDGRTFIYLCRKNSPAREAGLQEQDRILRVNGKPVEEFSLFQLRKLLKQEGEDVRMTIQRGEKTFDVEFRLREFRTFLPEPAEEAPAEK